MEHGLAEVLFPWYREHRRDLSFRRTKDPYAILVAEVLLQRTRIVSGLPYFERFMDRFPTVASLARASEDDVLKAWEGLGFYGRARNLHRAAKVLVTGHGGKVPGTFSALRELPGIGDYTAGAVASIAFGERVPAVDGNAIRVLSRVFRLSGDLTRGDARRRLFEIAASLVPPEDPGTYNQARMEGIAGAVDHTFSHRRWTGNVYRMRVSGVPGNLEGTIWASPEDLRRLPLVPFHRRFLERWASGSREVASRTARGGKTGEPF